MMFLLPLGLYRPFVGILAFDMISFMNPQQISWGIASAVPWAMLSFAVTIIGWAMSPTEPKRIPLNAFNVLVVLFLVGITVNMQYALNPPDLAPDTEWTSWSRVFKIFLLLPITVALATDRRRINALIWVIIISLGVYILDQGGASIVTLGHHKASGPPKSPIVDNNEFACAVLIAVPLMNYLRMQSRHAIIRAGFMLAMVISVLTALASYSRGALVTAAVIAIPFWLRSRRKMATLAIATIGVIALFELMPDAWWERMQTIRDRQGDTSIASRFDVWYIGWRLAMLHPYTGAGFHVTLSRIIDNAFVPGFKPLEIHSIWLQILGEQGFIVGAIWLMITVVSLWNTWKLTRLGRQFPQLSWAYDLGRMSQISILAYLVGGTFLPISTWEVYFSVLAIVCAARAVAAREAASPILQRMEVSPPLRAIPSVAHASVRPSRA